MIEHVLMGVNDMEKSKAFYAAALAPLGVVLLEDYPAKEPGAPSFCAFGIGEKPILWLKQNGEPVVPIHIAFRAEDHEMVDQFHAAALAAGGTDHGQPGLRTEYHASYYGAFALDPDGYNIEAVYQER